MAVQLSIIVDNYNYADFVGDAIESALSQDETSMEVIVVDDGSTDNSRHIIASFGDRVKSVLKANGGQASAFNAGFAVSKGALVLFLDADDTLLKGAARQVVEAARHVTDLSRITWPMKEIDAAGRTTGRLHPRHGLDQGDCRRMLIERGPLNVRSAPTSGNAFARAVLEKLLPMPETPFRVCADGYLLLLTPLYGRIAVMDEPLSCYRVHGTNALSGLSEFERAQRLWDRYPVYTDVLQRHLLDQGIDFDPGRWHTADHYLERVRTIAKAIESHIDPDETFVLIDEDRLNAGRDVLGRHRLYVLDRDEGDGGLPADDAPFDRLLKELQSRGATHLVITGDCFWWLNHYDALREHLEEHAVCVLHNSAVGIWKFTG